MKFLTPQIKIATVIFIALNVLLYVFLYLFNDRIPFNYENYQFNATKFIKDSRVSQGKFDLINNLAQFDAQWYLKIAEVGYPTNPHSTALEVMDGATFAFFPLYPIVLRILNIFIMNILFTGFLFANFMLLINFLSLIYVLKKFTDEKIAIRTAFLLFLFPFSIFFRSYFTEALLLFLLIWFSNFFVKKQYIMTGAILGLLTLTRGSAVILYIFFVYYLISDFKAKSLSILKVVLSIFLAFTPLACWMLYSNIKTGSFTFFMQVRSSWSGNTDFINQFINNIEKVSNFNQLAIHSFHSSKIDVILFISIGVLLFLSLGKIKEKLWVISFSIFITPLFFSDLMSFARYQIISFPLFLFLSQFLNNRLYYIVLVIFTIGLLAVSLLFVNWYWVG